MRNLLRFFLFFLIFVSLALSTWYVAHKDINFFTDIARDFLLFNEITQKKIILIGPRSSAGGLFHGPFWLYLNYPAYALGHGDPVVVGWYWIFLIAIFLIICFIIGKKLFNEWTGWLYTLLIATYFIFNANWLHNAFGALFMMPLLFFFFIKYISTLRVRYLMLHAIALGCMIDFQVAIGAPFALLSILYIVVFVIRKKKYPHLAAYGVLGIVLGNYIIFDLRHHFLFLKGILHNASPAAGNAKISLMTLLHDRLGFFTNLQLPTNGSTFLIGLTSLAFIVFFVLQLRQSKYKKIYLTALYFYIGYVIFTLASRNILTTGQSLPIVPLLFLIFSSFITSKYLKLFIFVYAIVYLTSMSTVIPYFQRSKTIMGKAPDSWNFLLSMTNRAFAQKDKDFGYFVYSPDAFGYQPKYAMYYGERLYPGRAHYLQKKSVTYVIAAPPPIDNPYMQDAWWVRNIAHINKKPQSVTTFPNGYKIERYLLTAEETKVPYDPNIDVGIFFR